MLHEFPFHIIGLDPKQDYAEFRIQPTPINTYHLSWLDQRTLQIRNHQSQQGSLYTLDYQKNRRNEAINDGVLDCFIVKSGTLNITIGTQYYNFHKNQMLFFNTNTPHIIEPSPGLELIIIAASRDFFMKWPFTFEVKTQMEIPYPDAYANALFTQLKKLQSLTCYSILDPLQQNLMDKYFDNIGTLLINQSSGYSYQLYAGIYRIFELLQNPLVKKEHIIFDKDPELVLAQEVMKFLNENPRKMSAAEIAEVFRSSASHIKSGFKKHVGKSLYIYNREVYLLHSLDLLKSTEMSVAEIIAEVGFVNKTQFYALFKETFACTPFEYRDAFKKRLQP